MLTPAAQERLALFIASYAHIRTQEGRGSSDARFYRSLPYPDGLDSRWRRHWKIRAQGFESLVDGVVLPMEGSGEPLTILDLGAGNGWLSNRLAERGHDVVAVDLQTNDYDGLGCHKYYETQWLPVQAEFDHLPIANSSIDLVIFNASLHYSPSLRVTVSEALRVLKPHGRIAVLDSPIYRSERSGQKMIAKQPYASKLGVGYLTWSALSHVAMDLGLTTEVTLTPRTFSELLLRLAKRFYLRREPANFGLVVFSRETPPNRPF